MSLHVKLLKSFGVYQVGQTALFTDLLGEHLVKMGIAELLPAIEPAAVDPNKLRSEGFKKRQVRKKAE